MATFVTPRTWVTGEVTTANYFNTNLRDNSNFLFTPPACKVGANAFSVAGGVLTPVSCSAENFDTDNMHSPGDSKVTIQTSGKYFIAIQTSWESNTAGLRDTYLYRNGVTNLTSTSVTPTSGGRAEYSLVDAWALSAGEYLEVDVLQNSGSVLTVSIGFAVIWVSG